MATVLQHSPGVVQLGELLRATRERRGLTLQQVSSTTKIPWRHLDAIEHGDFSVVPEGPYRRGEVRAIAQAIGLDQKVAVARLEEALGTSTREAPAPPRSHGATARTPWLVVLATAAAIATTAALTIWTRQTAVASGDHARTGQPPRGQEPQGPPLAPPQPAVAAAATVEAPVEAAVEGPVEGSVEGPGSSVPAAAAASPVLVVTSEPAGARVVIDGIGRGTTPVTVQYLPLGEKHVRVVRDGYVSEERRVRLTASQPTTTVQVELQPVHQPSVNSPR